MCHKKLPCGNFIVCFRANVKDKTWPFKEQQKFNSEWKVLSFKNKCVLWSKNFLYGFLLLFPLSVVVCVFPENKFATYFKKSHFQTYKWNFNIFKNFLNKCFHGCSIYLLKLLKGGIFWLALKKYLVLGKIKFYQINFSKVIYRICGCDRNISIMM